jgi:predicted ATPase
LLQPRERLPRVIFIDEPELGLHPAAVNVLGGLIRSVSHFCQVIIATQSPLLVDQFRPEDIIVMERTKVQGKNEYCSEIKQGLSSEQLKDWLEDYSLGDLWQKNLLGGRP